MKHTLVIVFFWLFPFLLLGEKPNVVASASMMADMTRVIGGDLIKVEMIVPIGGDPHLHEPTPRDAQLVAAADLIFINGLTFEGWMNELIENSGTKGKIVTVTKGIDVLTSLTYHNSADPHAWMTAKNGLVYIKNIRDALVELLPDQADRLNANYESYKKQLEEMQAYMHAAILTIPESQRVLITSHDAFQYYGREYGLTLEAIMGISTESEAQTSDIMRVNRIIDERNVPALFVESTINPKLMQQIAADKKVKIGGKLFADSLADPSLPAGTYLGMLKHNTDTIVDALKEKRVVTTEEEKGINWLAILGLGGLMLVALLIVLKRIS